MLVQTFLLLVMAMSMIFNSQKYVTVNARSESMDIENGKPFFILLTLKPAGGIHVNVQPPITAKSVNGSATLNVKEIPKAGEYLDPSKPVKVECRVTDASSGSHKISFIVGYTFCSDKESWCRMENDTVSVTVKVKE
jgi:hypothetical protein